MTAAEEAAGWRVLAHRSERGQNLAANATSRHNSPRRRTQKRIKLYKSGGVACLGEWLASGGGVAWRLPVMFSRSAAAALPDDQLGGQQLDLAGQRRVGDPVEQAGAGTLGQQPDLLADGGQPGRHEGA